MSQPTLVDLPPQDGPSAEPLPANRQSISPAFQALAAAQQQLQQQQFAPRDDAAAARGDAGDDDYADDAAPSAAQSTRAQSLIQSLLFPGRSRSASSAHGTGSAANAKSQKLVLVLAQLLVIESLYGFYLDFLTLILALRGIQLYALTVGGVSTYRLQILLLVIISNVPAPFFHLLLGGAKGFVAFVNFTSTQDVPLQLLLILLVDALILGSQLLLVNIKYDMVNRSEGSAGASSSSSLLGQAGAEVELREEAADHARAQQHVALDMDDMPLQRADSFRGQQQSQRDAQRSSESESSSLHGDVPGRASIDGGSTSLGISNRQRDRM